MLVCMSHPFIRALHEIGGATLARELKISPQAVSKYKRRAESDPSLLIPAHWVPAVVRLSKDPEWAQVLRPDLYTPAAPQ